MSNLGLRLAASKSSRTTAAIYASTHIKRVRLGVRNLHQRRALLYRIEDGLGDFLPPAALKVVAVDFQQGLLERLNDEVRGTEEEGLSVTQTVINTAPNRSKTLAFNYASTALNNSFFLDILKPPPNPPAKNHETDISIHLNTAIRFQHGSIAQLKSTFSSAALGLATSGWIWFVTDKSGNTGVIPTFGPGTLVIRSRSHMAHNKGLLLGEDLAQWGRGDPIPKEQSSSNHSSSRDSTPNPPPSPVPTPAPVPQSSPPGVSPSSPTSGVSGSNTPATPSHLLPRFFHSAAPSSFQTNQMPTSIWEDAPETVDIPTPRTKVDMLNIGETLYPLFCISVHEHCWISAGYGVWGKEDWLKQFWTVLDWDKVSQAYQAAFPDRNLT